MSSNRKRSVGSSRRALPKTYGASQATVVSPNRPEALDYLDKTVLHIRTTVPSAKLIKKASLPQPIAVEAHADLSPRPSPRHAPAPMRHHMHQQRQRSGYKLAVLSACGVICGMVLIAVIYSGFQSRVDRAISKASHKVSAIIDSGFSKWTPETKQKNRVKTASKLNKRGQVVAKRAHPNVRKSRNLKKIRQRSLSGKQATPSPRSIQGERSKQIRR